MIDSTRFEQLAQVMHAKASAVSEAKLRYVAAEKEFEQARKDSAAASRAFHEYVAGCANMQDLPNALEMAF